MRDIRGLVTKPWYPHYFNSKSNLDISYFGADEMRSIERREFVIWYNSQKNKFFDNKLGLEKYR